MARKKYRIAVIPGDGIGKETMPEGLRVLDAAARRFGFELELRPLRLVLRALSPSTGAMMPEDGLEQLREHDAIFLGAVGWPGVPDHVSLWGLLIPIRRGFDQYVNLRPCKLMPGARTPAGRPQAGGHRLLRRAREHRGRVFQPRRPDVRGHRPRVRRPSRRCSPATAPTASCATPSNWRRRRRRKKLTSATKSNGITFTMPYWDERFAAMAKQLSARCKTDQFHIDILCAHFVQHPDWFDVVVGTNLFGDILSRPRPGGGRVASASRRAPTSTRRRLPLDVRAGARLGAGHRRQVDLPTRSARSGRGR